MKIANRLIAVAALVAMGACSSDGGTGPVAPTLAGTWRATSVQLTSINGPIVTVDLINMGATIQLVLNPAGTFTLTSTIPDEGTETVSGTWTSTSDVLSLTYTIGDVGTDAFEMALTASTLTLTGGHTEFDFDDDGVEEDAALVVVFARQ